MPRVMSYKKNKERKMIRKQLLKKRVFLKILIPRTDNLE
jgi:hypothetical protein